MRSITARDFPCLENTGTLVAMFDLVHRKRKLPGPGFVESLLQDTFFQVQCPQGLGHVIEKTVCTVHAVHGIWVVLPLDMNT